MAAWTPPVSKPDTPAARTGGLDAILMARSGTGAKAWSSCSTRHPAIGVTRIRFTAFITKASRCSHSETQWEIVAALQGLLPDCALNPWFLQIVGEGTGHRFDMSCNKDWLRHTRPILEAFFHARFMLEMAVRHAELEEPPQTLPSGWAALLYLYGLR